MAAPDTAAVPDARSVTIQAPAAANDATTEAAAAPAKPYLGWQGSRYGNLVEGVHEHREAIAKRRRLKLLPEINKLVGQLWALGVRRGARMDLRGYMDYHLSCFHFVTSMEEQVDLREVHTLVDLYEAWEHALCDWTQDTADVLARYGTRTLHYDSFRDSVFELIDLYTPTTDEKQYIGYLRRLVKKIAIVDANGAPTAWRHPWPPKLAAGKRLAAAMRDGLGGEGAEGVGQRFSGWLAAQEAARAAAVRADAEAAGRVLTDAQLAETLDSYEELMPRGLAAAYVSLAESGAAALPLPPSVDDVLCLLRVLDVDMSGGLSASDLTACLVDRVASPWLSDKGSRGALRVARVFGARKAKSSGGAPPRADAAPDGEMPRPPKTA